jgi:hypothetical protein
MRGEECVQWVKLSTLVLEDRVRVDHPLRTIRRLIDPILRNLSLQCEALYSPLDLARAAAAGPAAAAVLFDPRRAAAGRAARVQTALPTVCRPRPAGGGVARTRLP